MNGVTDPLAAADSPEASQPTRVRYLVVALTMLMAFLLYLDRFCLTMSVGYIKEDLGLADWQVGWLLGSFFLTYALCQVPSGWLGDRFGARRTLTGYILLWSLFTGWMGLAGSFAAVLALRLGCGVAQAGAYPTGAGTVSKWVPFPSRAMASALVSLGGRIGGAAAPVLTAYLLVAFVPLSVPSLLQPADLFDEAGLRSAIASDGPTATAAQKQLGAVLRELVPVDASGPAWLAALNDALRRPDLFDRVTLDDFALEREGHDLARVPPGALTAEQVERRNRLLLEAAYPAQVRKVYTAGWRPVIVVFGLAGLVVAAAYWLGVRDRPEQHPAANAAEAELIARSLPAGVPSSRGESTGLPLVALLTNVSMWLNSAQQFLINVGWLFLLTWLPRYLDEVHRVPVLARSWMTTWIIVIGIVGQFVGGWLTDRATRRLGLRWGRGLPIVLTKFVSAAAFFAALGADSPWEATAAMALVAFSVDLGIPALWAYAQDVGGRNVGAVLGWGNMWGNLGAFASPIALAWVIQRYGWDGVFIACGSAFVLAGVLSLGIDATSPIVPHASATKPAA